MLYRPVAQTVAVLSAVLLLAACSSASSSSAPSSSAPASPASPSATRSGRTSIPVRPALQHLVIVVEENHSAADITNNPAAPYLNQLMAHGTTLANFFAITHPSEPNYLALFSGSTQGVTDDTCPHTVDAPNLAGELVAAHRSFAGYSEGLPSTGFTGCADKKYARKHVPWTDFSSVPASVNRPVTAFPSDYTRLPTVSFVIPDLDHDMHDGTIGQADTWLRTHLGSYITWARTHDSALIVTWDEDDHSENNQIPPILAGDHVRATRYAPRADQYDLLSTIEWLYRLPSMGHSVGRSPITGIWAG